MEEAAEAAALADEADMPLEQLLARYGLVMGNGSAASDHGEEDAMEVDGDGPEEAPSKDTEAPAQPVKIEDAVLSQHSRDVVDTGDLLQAPDLMWAHIAFSMYWVKLPLT